MKEEGNFHEEQGFEIPWLKAFLGIVGTLSTCLLGYGIYQQSVLGLPFGNHPGPTWLLGLVLGLQLLLFVGIFSMLHWMKLVTEVRDGYLFVMFKPFLDRAIPIRDIRSAEPRTYRPIREYGGWGIRMGVLGYGKAYNAHGNRGVQLVLENGDKLLIGSQKPEDLALVLKGFMN